MPSLNTRPLGRLVVVKTVGAVISFRDDATKGFELYLNDLALRARDLERPNTAFGEYLVKRHIPLQFQQQGTPKKWKKLNALYKEWKDRHFPNRPILVLTGKMKAGFRSQTTARTLRVTNKQNYWQYHQTGGENLPARPMIQLVAADRNIYREFVRDWLIQQTGGGVL